MVEDNGIIFLTYGGFLSQTLISGMTEALERETEESNIGMGVSNNIFTIFIEMSQNIMNYSQAKDPTAPSPKAEGIILVSKDKSNNYCINSQNIVLKKDMERIIPRLDEIETLDKDGLKKRYRELRRSGKNSHEKGGGIGFFEIAKRCDKIEYDFNEIDKTRYYFHFKVIVETKKKDK